MKRILGIIGILLSSALSAGAIDWKIVTELDRFEPFEAHRFHAGVLWVGRSRKDLGAFYQLEVYDSTGKALATAALTHSARHLYPYGADSVLIVGISYKDNLTHYTIATRTKAGVRLEARTIPLGAFADEWAGAPGRLIFTDPGGLDEGELGGPQKTLFTMVGGRFRYLKAKIHGPHYPILLGNTLYLLEFKSIAAGTGLLKVDLASETPAPVLAAKGDSDYARLFAIDGGKALAITDRGTDEVLIYDVAKGQVVQKMAIAAGSPRGLAEWGKCLLVGSQGSKKVSFIDWRTGKLLTEWDFSGAGAKLFGLAGVTVDPKSGVVFVRSNYPVAIGDPTPDHNSVVMGEDRSGETAKLCAQ